jgi:DNA-binding response OmpR family regulator
MNEHIHVLLLHQAGTGANRLVAFLTSEHYRTSIAHDGVSGLNLLRANPPDLVILDADLPRIDGITLCGAIRKQSRTPIILLTSQDDEIQQIIGLDRGADLCLARTVSEGELRARLRSLLRRANVHTKAQRPALTIGELRVDVQTRRAWLAGSELQLTPREFDLLAYLMHHRGIAVARDQLLKDVWGGRVGANSQTLDVHIRWLRQKVEPNPEQPVYIRTVRMIGYRFEGP